MVHSLKFIDLLDAIKNIAFLSILFFNTLSAQFSLDIVYTDQSSIEIFIPSGNVNRKLFGVQNADTIIRIDLGFCSSGCNYKIENLQPSSAVRFLLVFNQDTLSSIWGISSSLSTKTIEVYFTTEVDPEFRMEYPVQGIGGSILESQIIHRIDQAQLSIDAALYNINRRNIVNALTAAYNRGVRVRYVTGDDTSNSALSNPTPPFPIVIGNQGDPLMHHKFFVIDAELPASAWVITGATNMTTFQMYQDHNNTLMIQDQSLAIVYQMEMDEMWGSSSQLPELGNSKFGSVKTNNTPHKVFLNEILVETYFSPSDQTTFNIINALNKAQESVYFALLTFTRSNLATTIINLKNRGVQIRGLIENFNDSGSEYNRLLSNGVFVLKYDESPQLHHKYAVTDPFAPSGKGMVITGSHNWTNNAENNNDENTLIIHDQFMAKVFFSEFQARWCEVFPLNDGTCRLRSSSTLDWPNEKPSKINASYNHGVLHLSDIKMSLNGVSVFDLQGRRLMAIKLGNEMLASPQLSFNIPGLIPGMYLLEVEHTSLQISQQLFIVQP
jgi:phosphatidylserine/phosphatidylglycerophosphate/cardiolipin synthase-like enzyme